MKGKSIAKKIGWGVLIYIGVLLILSLILAYLADSRPQAIDQLQEKAYSALSDSDRTETVATGQIIPDYAPTLGNPSADITIVEFSDFSCPFCKASFSSIRRLLETYPDRIHFVYRHFPLESIHPNAKLYSHASMCANEQGKFWELHDKLFQEQDSVTPEALVEIARSIGIDSNKFLSCQSSGRWYDEIEQDLADAIQLGGRGTPTWSVNGQLVQGVISYENWELILDALSQ